MRSGSRSWRGTLIGHARQSRVGTGDFGARMAVSLVNDGPVTIVLDL